MFDYVNATVAPSKHFRHLVRWCRACRFCDTNFEENLEETVKGDKEREMSIGWPSGGKLVAAVRKKAQAHAQTHENRKRFFAARLRHRICA